MIVKYIFIENLARRLILITYHVVEKMVYHLSSIGINSKHGLLLSGFGVFGKKKTKNLIVLHNF